MRLVAKPLRLFHFMPNTGIFLADCHLYSFRTWFDKSEFLQFEVCIHIYLCLIHYACKWLEQQSLRHLKWPIQPEPSSKSHAWSIRIYLISMYNDFLLMSLVSYLDDGKYSLGDLAPSSLFLIPSCKPKHRWQSQLALIVYILVHVLHYGHQLSYLLAFAY